jgi:hypothetical protein
VSHKVTISSLQKKRWSPATKAFEKVVKKKWTARQIEETPWAPSVSDHALMKMALSELVKKVSSREMGNRFSQLFSPGKKPRTHHYFVLASAYGK